MDSLTAKPELLQWDVAADKQLCFYQRVFKVCPGTKGVIMKSEYYLSPFFFYNKYNHVSLGKLF